MATTKLRRAVTTGGLEIRTTANGVSVEGHASTFNQSYDMGWYQETVAPGAFARTLKTSPDVRLLVNHDGLPWPAHDPAPSTSQKTRAACTCAQPSTPTTLT